MSQAASLTRDTNGFFSYTRRGGKELELPYEKPVTVPVAENKDVSAHAWADARFATDIMAEHALFFPLFMPPEVAGPEREEALVFNVRRESLKFVAELKRAV